MWRMLVHLVQKTQHHHTLTFQDCFQLEVSHLMLRFNAIILFCGLVLLWLSLLWAPSTVSLSWISRRTPSCIQLSTQTGKSENDDKRTCQSFIVQLTNQRNYFMNNISDNIEFDEAINHANIQSIHRYSALTQCRLMNQSCSVNEMCRSITQSFLSLSGWLIDWFCSYVHYSVICPLNNWSIEYLVNLWSLNQHSVNPWITRQSISQF